MSIATRIRQARKDARLTQRELAARSGIKQPTLSDLESGKSQSTGAIAVIAAVLGVSALWLSEGRGPKLPGGDLAEAAAPASERIELREVPLISWVQAGSWAKVVNPRTLADVEEWVPIPANAGPRSFALLVKGESMKNPDGEPTFNENDRIIVDPDRVPLHRSFVVVQLSDEVEATFKQLIIEDGAKYLKALNPDWPNRIFQINGNAMIAGVVIGKHVTYI